MKTACFLVPLCASFVLSGCTQTKRTTRIDSAQAGAAAPSSSVPVSGTYGNKETYPHAASDVSVSALIAGGATSSGPAVAPSATAIEGRLKEWRLLPAEIAAEIKSGQPIVRTKKLGTEAADDPSGDETLLTLVNNRLVADADTARITTKLQISHGEVTMNGSAASAGLVGRAIAIALDTKGVTKVTSELQLDPRLPGALRDAPTKTDGVMPK